MPKESTLRSMVLCLFLVCLACSALLGGVYVLTKDKIDSEQIKKTNNAIALVTPEFDNEPSSESLQVEIDGEQVTVYPARKDGEVVGYAVESFTSKGFSGTINVMVGFDMDGNIVGTSVISHAETPGLGAKMTEPAFYSQFEGRSPASFSLKVRKDGGDVDAITASTITSRAYCDAVDRAWRVYQKIIVDNSK
ncbi:MAG TPA: RnfABCDGE type electron transport complex subunit G [Candidatus Coprenecus stercoravium]|uniref:Ion-translocating oxidoreductase complex subunit G n=1 Tax=Candidatus Coprenecus stercoravium TaxID=2840735 RepID=A0A9D2GRS0_9BACT|nr:RnfABCDGE type electron transport complex subunit G [Candidatus Coprenecus stercoravium]